jgi:hypothetical protein|tara:strand:- start:610 stop:876 length:267 start_codon:yes stop_codon:yes gene_type:complete
MDDILNEKEYLEGIKSEISEIHKLHLLFIGIIDKMFDSITERVEYKKALIRKFEERVNEYEYEPEVMTNEELERTKKFGEVVKEIIGI